MKVACVNDGSSNSDGGCSLAIWGQLDVAHIIGCFICPNAHWRSCGRNFLSQRMWLSICMVSVRMHQCVCVRLWLRVSCCCQSGCSIALKTITWILMITCLGMFVTHPILGSFELDFLVHVSKRWAPQQVMLIQVINVFLVQLQGSGFSM